MTNEQRGVDVTLTHRHDRAVLIATGKWRDAILTSAELRRRAAIGNTAARLSAPLLPFPIIDCEYSPSPNPSAYTSLAAAINHWLLNEMSIRAEGISILGTGPGLEQQQYTLTLAQGKSGHHASNITDF